ncbi:MAG TPA: hypothetical protein VGF94_20155 [Kofleriaceae bacterium]|jgi:hypothetical protein
MKSLILVCLVATAAFAGPTKYHFELVKVIAKDKVKPDVLKEVQPRVEAQVKKAFATDPQLVADLGSDAPNPEQDHGEPYRRFLAKKGVASAYRVTVEISDASEDLQPMEGKPGSQRLVVRLAIHVLGETIPGRTMGFTGDGQATVKQEIGTKLRDRDRDYSWDGAAETAIADAMKTCFAQLKKGTPRQH